MPSRQGSWLCEGGPTTARLPLACSRAGPNAPEAAGAALEGAHFGIWTTTPWTIPANLAVAVNADLQYAVVEVQVGRQADAAGGACWVLACV